MLAYLAPAVLLLATLLGAQLAFGHLWVTAAAVIVVALLLPFGDLHGKPLIVHVIGLPTRARRKRRKGYRRHRYYSP